MYKPDFKPVLYAMIEPKLRLVVTVNQRLDDDPCIAIDFDPLLDDTHLTMAAPSFVPNASEVTMVFRSDEAQSLAKFWLRVDRRDDRLNIYILERDKPLAYDGRLTEKCAPWLTGQSSAVLPATFEAALEISDWDKIAVSYEAGITHIAMFVGPLTAKRFADGGFIAANDIVSGWALFRERPVKPR